MRKSFDITFLFFLILLIYAYVKYHYLYYNIVNLDMYSKEGLVTITFISILVFLFTIPFFLLTNKKSKLKKIKNILYIVYLITMFSFIYIFQNNIYKCNDSTTIVAESYLIQLFLNHTIVKTLSSSYRIYLQRNDLIRIRKWGY